jgi:hypothetical protein
MEIFKGGKSETTSGYSDMEGAKIDAFTSKAHAFFVEHGKTMEPGMLCDAIVVAAASSIGGGFKDRAALNRNLSRLTTSFGNVMSWAFDQAEKKRLAQKR